MKARSLRDSRNTPEDFLSLKIYQPDESKSFNHKDNKFNDLIIQNQKFEKTRKTVKIKHLWKAEIYLLLRIFYLTEKYETYCYREELKS